MAPIKVFIVEDHKVVCEALKSLLSTYLDIRVVGVAYDAVEALQKMEEAQPDVVLMDMRLPGLDGVEATKVIMERFPKVKVIALTAYDDKHLIIDALKAGVSGYVLKESPPEELVKAIRAAAMGKSIISEEIMDKVLEEFRKKPRKPSIVGQPLTQEEKEILRMAASGMKVREIAEKRKMRVGAVKTILKRIYRKLGAVNKAEAVALAAKRGLLDYSK